MSRGTFQKKIKQKKLNEGTAGLIWSTRKQNRYQNVPL